MSPGFAHGGNRGQGRWRGQNSRRSRIAGCELTATAAAGPTTPCTGRDGVGRGPPVRAVRAGPSPLTPARTGGEAGRRSGSPSFAQAGSGRSVAFDASPPNGAAHSRDGRPGARVHSITIQRANGSSGNWKSRTIAWRTGSPRSFAGRVPDGRPDLSRSWRSCSTTQRRSDRSAGTGRSPRPQPTVGGQESGPGVVALVLAQQRDAETELSRESFRDRRAHA